MPSEARATDMAVNTIDWQAVADELSGALRTTMLRNPTLTARDWDRATAALDRYEGAINGVEVEFRNPADV